MNAGIIAAGHGSRFFDAGWSQPKPLIPISGRPLIDYVMGNLQKSGIDEIGILLNGESRTDVVEEHLLRSESASRITVWRKTTRSSYESFSFVNQHMGSPPFLISTVDTIYDPLELEEFLNLDQYGPSSEVVLALTEFVHDSRPLWAQMNGYGLIQELGDEVLEKRYVTAGLYLVLRPLLGLGGSGFPALRVYLQHIVNNSGGVFGRVIRTAIDVDSPEDVALAEDFIKGLRNPIDFEKGSFYNNLY